MSFDNGNVFTKENLDTYLSELGKEYKKLGGKRMPAEIILIGGASIIANYGFRDMTTDIDAIIQATSMMKDAINHIGDRYGLPNGWINADFIKTSSYTSKLAEFSLYYRTFSGILSVRTVSGEYLIAMKLCAGRKYKNDLSDIVGILAEQEKSGSPISMARIEKAVTDLYGGWEKIPADSKSFIDDVMNYPNLQELYEKTKSEEMQSKELLLNFENDYPGVTGTDNVDNILKSLRERASSKISIDSGP